MGIMHLCDVGGRLVVMNMKMHQVCDVSCSSNQGGLILAGECQL